VEANAAYQSAWRNGPAGAQGNLADELTKARTALLECPAKESIIEPAGQYRVLREWDAKHQETVAKLLVARDHLYQRLTKAESRLFVLTQALYGAIDETDLPQEMPSVRQAHKALFKGYLLVLDGLVREGATSPSPDPLGTYANLQWMCETAIQNIDGFPVDKLGRWLGFVQGVLSTAGLIDATEDRDFSRPIFHTAYAADGIAIPATQEFQPK
jgi:hypothetical protein